MGLAKQFAHVSFTVTDLQATLRFYVDLLGGKLMSLAEEGDDTLGSRLMGRQACQQEARLKIALVDLCGVSVEFIQYLDPPVKPYHGNPSVAGSGHLALYVEDIHAVAVSYTHLGCFPILESRSAY